MEHQFSYCVASRFHLRIRKWTVKNTDLICMNLNESVFTNSNIVYLYNSDQTPLGNCRINIKNNVIPVRIEIARVQKLETTVVIVTIYGCILDFLFVTGDVIHTHQRPNSTNLRARCFPNWARFFPHCNTDVLLSERRAFWAADVLHCGLRFVRVVHDDSVHLMKGTTNHKWCHPVVLMSIYKSRNVDFLFHRCYNPTIPEICVCVWQSRREGRHQTRSFICISLQKIPTNTWFRR